MSIVFSVIRVNLLTFSEFHCIILNNRGDDMAYEIGLRIKKYREAKNITQKQLAEILKVTSSRIANWEVGVNRPDVDLLADICRALNVSPSELLDVRLDTTELTQQEQQLVLNYRAKTNLQEAINILLDLDD